MEVILNKRNEMLKSLKLSLDEVMSKKTAIESEYGRVKLECSDRQILHAQSVHAIGKIKRGSFA